jgi:hypothetical protein
MPSWESPNTLLPSLSRTVLRQRRWVGLRSATSGWAAFGARMTPSAFL